MHTTASHSPFILALSFLLLVLLLPMLFNDDQSVFMND